MPRQAPEVIAGKRQPRDTRMASMQEIERRESNPELAQVPVGLRNAKGTLYLSKFPSYRVSVVPSDVLILPNGQRKVQRGIDAKFREGRYLNDAKDKTTRKLIDDTLQSNSRFGKPGKSNADFWLASEQEIAMKEAEKASASAILAKYTKEELEEFLGTLEKGVEEDHALPA